MADYHVIYDSTFDAQRSGITYSLRISKKGFSGASTSILMASNPCVQDWSEDEPKKPIKGSSLKMNIINNGICSLADFYSNEDDTFLIELIRLGTDELLFTGYLVQDDCSEIQIDYNHIISLTATDNLGLLKDMPFNQAALTYGQPQTYTNTISSVYNEDAPFWGFSMPLPGITVANGQVITITGTGVCDGSYTVQFTGEYFGNYVIGVYGEVPTFGPATCTINYTTAVEILGFLSLKDVLRLCLMATNLELNYRVLAQLLPRSPGGTERWLEDAFIDCRTFLNDSTWQSCYDVLESIMKRFYASCFQSNGAWYIVRWGELWRYQTSGGTAFLGYQYDTNFDYDIDYTENNNFNFGNGDDIETGWLKSIVRPYQFVKETFNYGQLPSLLCNYDLQNLGDLITTYLSGTDTIYEYEMNCWEPYNPAHPENYFIRLIKDSSNVETNRFAVVKSEVWDSQRSCKSQQIPVSEFDVIDWSFSFKTANSEPGAGNVYFQCYLTDGTTTLHLDTSGVSGLPEGSWASTGAIRLTWPSGDNLNEWHTVSVKSLPVPFNGVINVFLAHPSSVSTAEVYFKDMSFNITNTVNGITQIIGQTHKDSQTATIKNSYDVDILMDDSKSPSIKGTLFLYSYTGYLRDKTTVWNYKYRGSEYNFPLGQTTTFEEMYQRYLARTKYNGVLLDLNQGAGDGFMLSMASTIKYTLTDPLRFVFGSLSINYANDTADCTLWQMCNGEESITDLELIDLYEFKYLYQNN